MCERWVHFPGRLRNLEAGPLEGDERGCLVPIELRINVCDEMSAETSRGAHVETLLQSQHGRGRRALASGCITAGFFDVLGETLDVSDVHSQLVDHLGLLLLRSAKHFIDE